MQEYPQVASFTWWLAQWLSTRYVQFQALHKRRNGLIRKRYLTFSY
ncbi:hypothetical protein IQ22_00776 [Pseudomonas duriflava]|uniref:Uncharacterized protein n=1 Tax=Pseudomonas duriflava TaxID=459528 RepID=A0A562QLG7_9PSED|nr:hypothetical protein IQ22_00776 [Pseudomonas duriflava]